MNKRQRREWRDLVLGSIDLTPAQKVVLLTLETFADYPAGTNARPGVELLTRRTALQDRAVRSALTRGQALGLIEQTARANPRARLAAVYRLLPQQFSTGTTVPVEDDRSTGTVMPLQSDFQPARDVFQPARDAFQPARIDISTGTAVPPTNPVPIQLHQSSNTDLRARTRAPRAHAHAQDDIHNEHHHHHGRSVLEGNNTSPNGSACPDDSEAITLSGELLCVRCGENEQHPFGDRLCSACMADNETHRTRFRDDDDTNIRRLFG